jgi:hypothetical protein
MGRIPRWTLALGLAAGLGIGAPSAAWAKDPEPGATLKEKTLKDVPGETLKDAPGEMPKDAPDAESRKQGPGRGGQGPFERCAGVLRTCSDPEMRDDGCWLICDCQMAKTDFKPCQYSRKTPCNKRLQDIDCEFLGDDEFSDDGWIDKHGVE